MSDKIKMIFAGDTFPVPKNFDLFTQGDTTALFGEKVCGLFKSADYSVCNLEGCLTDTGVAVEKIGPSVKAPTATLNALSKLGLKAATLANTHTLDFGETGHNEMRAALEKYGIEHFGTGDGVDNIKTHVTVEMNGRRVILYTVTELFPFNTPGRHRHGAKGYDEYAVCRELSALKEDCDFLVVLYHGGAEMTHWNTRLVRQRFHRMADNGADIIISQHTHAVGEEEHYHHSYLLYGVFGLPDSGRIYEAEGEPLNLEDLLDCVAGGAFDGGDNCPFVSKKRVKEGALSGVHGAYYCNRDSALQHIALTEGSGKFFDVRECIIYKADQFLTVGKLHVFLAEVKFQLQEGSHLKELSPEALQFLGKTAPKLVHGYAMRSFSSG